MTVAIVVLLAVLVVLHTLILVALVRPMLALGRGLTAAAGVAENVEKLAGRFAGE